MATTELKGVEEFRDIIMEQRNPHIAAGMARLMDLREEITTNDDLKLRPGVDYATRLHFIQLLQAADRDRRLITYNPENIDLKDDGIQNAIQIPPEVAAGMAAPDMLDVGINPYRGEQIQMGSSPLYTLPWDFTGGDPNIPLASQLELSNAGMLLISSVNRAIVGWTRLESGKRGRFIYVSDSLRMYAHYSEILALLHSIGGGGAYADFAQVRASDEPRGPGNAPNRKTEVPGTSALQHTAGK